jgi:hypothetical protein
MISKKYPKNKVTASEVISAVAAGSSFNFAIESIAKRVDVVSENYMTVKALSATAIGSALVYFGDSKESKASGFALLGVGGAAGASKIATMVVTSGNPVNGRRSLNGSLNNVLTKLNARKCGTVPSVSTSNQVSPLKTARQYQNLGLLTAIYGG